MPFSLVKLSADRSAIFCGQAQKKKWDSACFHWWPPDLVWKIIAHKPSFRAEANKQWKHQYAHKLQDQYCSTISHSALQTSNDTESFTQFHGHLAMTFGSWSKSRRTSSHVVPVEVSSSHISEEQGESKLSKNSQQHQNKINQQASRINSPEALNQKFSQLLEPKFLVNAITQAVASNLNIRMGRKPNGLSNGLGLLYKLLLV